MLKTLRDTLATMDANHIALPKTRIAIKYAIAKAESERAAELPEDAARNPHALANALRARV